MSPFSDKRFRALIVGQAVNGIGSWCALVAIWGYAAERFDAAPWQVAVLGLTWTVPGALLGPFAGIPTDRLDPRRVLIGADIAAAILALAMAASSTYWALVVASTFQGFAKSFAQPAFGALAPRIVADEQLVKANALLATSMQMSMAFGPLLGALAIETMGASEAFIIDAITYMVGVAVVMPLKLSVIHRGERGSLRDDAKEGIRVVRERPVVKRLFIAATGCYLLWGAGITLEPLYVREVLHRSPATFAFLQTAFGIMMVLCGLVVARIGNRVSNVWVLGAGSMVSGASAALYLATPWVGVAFIGIAMWGAATPFFATPLRTMLQRSTPMHTHGRVFAVDETLRSWAMAISTGTAGFAFTLFGARASGFIYGALPAIGALFAFGAAARLRGVVETGPGSQYAPSEYASTVSVVPGDL